MSHLERRQREKEELKEKMMDAAIQIAAEEDWQALTIRKIAEKIEYTPPIVYEYFKNKDDLIRELIYKGFRLLKIEFDKARENSSDTKSFLHKLSIAHWDFASENTVLYRLMFSPERPTPSEEMLFNFKMLHETFSELAGNDEDKEIELTSYWASLTRGAIFGLLIMPPPPHIKDKNLRDLYVKIIDRFIGSI
ncbi:MAG: TetR/AcrR family transcriptional regulator [Ignavibacteria bacterium]